MASNKPTSSSNSKSLTSDEKEYWISRIRGIITDEKTHKDDKHPVSIFSVPKTLMASDPKSYTPQQVGFGPYHYWRPQLNDEMERYKLDSTIRLRRQIRDGLEFENLVEELANQESEKMIRACYDKYLEFGGKTLAWMMAIDASFLLEFLQVYATKEGKFSAAGGLPRNMSHLIDYSGTNSAHNAILRDIVMLENQVPLFVLRKMLEYQYSSQNDAEEMLRSMLVGLFKALSPFKEMEDRDLPVFEVGECAHLLEFLYKMMTPTTLGDEESIIEFMVENAQINQEVEEGKEGSFGRRIWRMVPNLCKGPILCLHQRICPLRWKIVSYFRCCSIKSKGSDTTHDHDDKEERKEPESFGNPKYSGWQLLSTVWRVVKHLNKGPVRSLNRVLSSKPAQVITKLPWKNAISTIPGLQCLDYSQAKEEVKPEDKNSKSNIKPPLVEEINIPSVTELSSAGVRFLPTKGNISSVKFDFNKGTLSLPIVCLEVNTEVLMRNLVAYEASIGSGQLTFTRYTELMNGIIDTNKDVKLLRAGGIIINFLKNDEEAAKLWNGMSTSLRLTKQPFLDKVIKNVNDFYHGRWKVKFRRFMKLYVFGLWPILSLLAAICMLFLTAMQSFCSVYPCPEILKIATTD